MIEYLSLKTHEPYSTKLLNKAGSLGWDLVTIIQDNEGVFHYTFKRPSQVALSLNISEEQAMKVLASLMAHAAHRVHKKAEL